MVGNFDLIIIGGGAAGFAAAIRADELGARTLMVNSGLPLGGTCVNVGCVPSKRLLHAGEIMHLAKSHTFSGIELQLTRFSFSQVVEDEIKLVTRMREEKYQKVLSGLKNIVFIDGNAKFISPHEITIDGTTYTGDKFVICTGSTAGVPPIEGIRETGFLTHIEALKLKNRPEKLLVIGAGPMGLEFSQIFSRFGTRVTVLESQPTIFQAGERSLVDRLAQILISEGIDIITDAKVKKASLEGKSKKLIFEVKGKEQVLMGDEILLATGKIPNTDGLGLDKAGVVVDRKKAVVVNEFLQTSSEHIFAAGDCTNLPMRLETTAGREGSLAADNALTGSKKSIDYRTVPYTIFTDPQLAGVGITEDEEMEMLDRCLCRTLLFSELPKAIIMERTEGALKLVVHPETNQVLGVHILAPQAGDLIAQGMLIVKNKMTVEDIIDALPVFPTLSEAIKLCALSFIKDISKLSCCV